MFPLHPLGDPYLINFQLFGIPIAVRWYGVMIVGGAMLAGWLAARRAERRGFDPEHIWNLLLLGMVLGIAGARAYYVAFEWERFAGRPWLEIINPAGGGGGLAIHGALIGAVLAALVYTQYHKLPFVTFLDICMPGFLLAQAIGRWGNFFNQEAYGRPTNLPFGVVIDSDQRLNPFRDTALYPPNTLFHATFLYESLWNVVGVALLLGLERRLRGWRRTGDIALFYAIYYGVGRLWVEGLRTDSLCTNGVGGSCEDALRAAQVVSLLLIAGGVLGVFINHRRPLTAAEVSAISLPPTPVPYASADSEVAEPTAQEPVAAESDAEQQQELSATTVHDDAAS